MSIEHLKEMKLVACMGCKRLMDCDESIQDQCGFMVLIEALYEAGFRKQEWISVEHRLPDPNEYDWVLVNVMDELDGTYLVPQVAELRNGEWFGLDDFHSIKDLQCTVTHWMPLPDYPNEKGGNQ